MGLGNIRTCVYGREKQLEYDESFHPVIQNLIEMKRVKDKCRTLIVKHVEAVKQGSEGKFHGHQIDINEPIDDELNIFFKDFFIRGQMAVEALIRHSLYMGSNIGFLFSKEDKKFRQGLKNFVLKEDDERFKALNLFINNHKDVWYSSFRDLRRRIEHDGWSLPALKYTLDGSMNVQVIIPAFPDKSIPDMLEIFWQHMINFCEEVVVFLLSLKLKDHMVIVYLSEDQRDPHMPARYIVSLKEFPGVPLQCS